MSEDPGSVLVVEDDPILRDTLVEVLHDELYEVRSAANGRAALDLLGEWEPDVIVLDLMMPSMDAYDFRRHQQDAGLATGARVLIVSAARDLHIAAERIGADAWIAKPFRLVEVIEVVERLVGERAA